MWKNKYIENNLLVSINFIVNGILVSSNVHFACEVVITYLIQTCILYHMSPY